MPEKSLDEHYKKSLSQKKKTLNADELASQVPAARPDSKGSWWQRAADSFWGQVTDTVEGIPELPGFAWSLAKEMDISDMAQRFIYLIDARLTGDKEKHRQMSQDFIRDYPIFTAMMEAKSEAMGGAALREAVYNYWGGPEWQKFKKMLSDDPFAVFVEYTPAVTKLLKGAGYTKIAKGVEYIDPQNLPGAVLEQSIRAVNKKKPDPKANPNVKTTYGVDAEGNPKTTSKPAKDMSTEYGAGPENTPIQGLVDDDLPKHFETAADKAEATKYGEVIDEQRQATAGALREKEQRIVGDSPRDVDVWDPEEVGNRAIRDDYKAWRSGKRMPIETQLDRREPTLQQPLQVTQQVDTILQNTRAEMEKLVRSSSGSAKRPNNPEVRRVVTEIEAMIESVKDGGTLTIQEFRQLRTDFYEAMQDAIGTGSPTDRIYNSLTQDFFRLLEREVERNPTAYPENFIDSISVADDQWRRIRDLDGTSRAAKLLRKHDADPKGLIDRVLKPDTKLTDTEIADLKTILGDEGWDNLRAGMLARIFQKSKTSGNQLASGGLVGVLGTINSTDKNKVRHLFGDDMAKSLHEMANFTNRVFSKNQKWDTAFAEIIETDPNFPEALHATGTLKETVRQEIRRQQDQGNIPKNLNVSQLQTALGVFSLFDIWRVRKQFFSKKGRELMLEGRTWHVPIGNGRTIPIDMETLNTAAELIAKNKTLFGYTTRTVTQTEERSKKKKITSPLTPLRGMHAPGRRPVR